MARSPERAARGGARDPGTTRAAGARSAGTGGRSAPGGAAKRPASGRGEPPAKVRIVGGDWKRTPLAVVDAPGLRPTPDRVRETLFNWLGQRLEGWTCLDLYAGTGALGLEAASRGAARVVCVERESRAVAALRDAKAKLKADAVEVVQGDALAWLSHARDRFDLVFLDPPFDGAELARVLPRLAGVLAPDAAVYVEADRPLSPDAPPLSSVPGLVLHRADKAGQVHYHLLHLTTSAPGA